MVIKINMLHSIFNLLRIKDWLKNLLIFVPLIFSNNLFQSQHYYSLITAFIIFSLASSIIYIINDIQDIDEDKIHPIKKSFKPLANGKLQVSSAKAILALLVFLIIIFLYLDKTILNLILLYLALNIAYNYFFKKLPVIDILLISFGYLIRVESGSEVIDVNTSYLTFISIFFLSSFIISIKRKKELENNQQSRKSLKYYNFQTLNIFIYLSMLISFSSYVFYTIFINSILIMTLPLVIMVFLRYLYIVRTTSQGEFPIDIVIFDWKLMLLFGAFLIIIFYSFLSF